MLNDELRMSNKETVTYSTLNRSPVICSILNKEPGISSQLHIAPATVQTNRFIAYFG